MRNLGISESNKKFVIATPLNKEDIRKFNFFFPLKSLKIYTENVLIDFIACQYLGLVQLVNLCNQIIQCFGVLARVDLG